MAQSEYFEEDFIISLSIDGTEYEDVEVKVTDPSKTIRDQVAGIVEVFGLPTTDSSGNCMQYLLGVMTEDSDEPAILEFDGVDGMPLSMLDYNIQPGDALCLISVPLYACPIPREMERELHNNQLNGTAREYDVTKEDFIISLSIEGTEYVDIDVKVTDPYRAIRDQIARIVEVFDLPTIDGGGNCMQYLLGEMTEDSDEPEILEFDDEYGRVMTLVDYNIQPGDHLYLISVPLAGYACPIPEEMQKEWNAIYRQILVG